MVIHHCFLSFSLKWIVIIPFLWVENRTWTENLKVAIVISWAPSIVNSSHYHPFHYRICKQITDVSSLIRFDQVKLVLPRKTQPHITKTKIDVAQEKVATKAPVQAPGLVHLGQPSLNFSYQHASCFYFRNLVCITWTHAKRSLLKHVRIVFKHQMTQAINQTWCKTSFNLFIQTQYRTWLPKNPPSAINSKVICVISIKMAYLEMMDRRIHSPFIAPKIIKHAPLLCWLHFLDTGVNWKN